MEPLKLSYDNETDIPEGFAALYTEKGGKWTLTGVEGLKTSEDVKRLDSALRAERDAHKKTKEAAKKLEKLGDRDIDQLIKDAEEAPDLREELEEIKKGGSGKDAQALVEAAVERERKRLQREIDNAKKATADVQKQLEEERAGKEQLTTKIRTSTVRSEITKAANAASLRKEAVDDVLRYQDMFEITDDDKVITRDGVGVAPGLSPAEWLADRKADRPHWWPDSVGGGLNGGGKGAGGENVFKKKPINLTEVSQLVGTDRAKAERQARDAGHASVEAAVAAAAAAAGKRA